MRVGITFDLKEAYFAAGFTEEEVAEFDRPDTIRAIADALRELGHTPESIGNVKQLAARLVAGDRWDLVFNIAEGLYGFGREAQIPALLDAWRIPYTFSDPMALSLALHKGMTKRVVRDCGVPTADFALIEALSDLAAIDLPYPLFAKPVAEGTGKGIDAVSRISSAKQLNTVCRDLLVRYRQPVLVETYLPGREFTVGVIGTGREARILGAMEVLLGASAEPGAYSYNNKARFEGRVEYRLTEGELARSLGQVALSAWRSLCCRDGGRIDLRLDADGVPNFIEVNPLAGLNPEISDLAILCRLNGIDYQALIGMIVNSALQRTESSAALSMADVEAA
ncbi:MAG: D-alanine--D-alanine ligase [Gammaproteobacteria bacterium]|nr:D-alanine--D-alanine ligase [Gammaproteobacteria bacterium]